MAKREPVRLELRFERRPEGAGLDARGARGLVDLEHAAQLAQVDRHRRLVSRRIAAWLDAADDARSAAERRHARLRAAGPVEHGRDLLLIARIGDHVRRVAVVADKPAYIIGERFAVGVRRAVIVRGRAERQRWRWIERGAVRA